MSTSQFLDFLQHKETAGISFEAMISFVKKHSVLVIAIGVTGVSLFGVKRYFGGGVFRGSARLDGKTAIVTGANIGIGKETAKEFAKRGARVILACRDITKAERAAADIRATSGNENVVVKVVDLASLKSVRNFAENINKTEENVHLLVNNAGVMACPQWQSEDGYELQFATNHLGHFLLTNLLTDKLKQSAPSRVVNLSSIAHKKGAIDLEDVNFEKREYSNWVSYRQSKLANILFTRELHSRLQGSGVTTYSLHPGVVRTELIRYINLPVWKMFIIRYVLGPIVLKNPWQGAQTSLYCSLAEGIEEHSGKYFSDCAVAKVEPHAADDVMAAKLWTLSEEMIQAAK